MNKQKQHHMMMAFAKYQEHAARLGNLQQTQRNHQAMLKPMVRAIRTIFINGLPQGWGQNG